MVKLVDSLGKTSVGNIVDNCSNRFQLALTDSNRGWTRLDISWKKSNVLKSAITKNTEQVGKVGIKYINYIKIE